MSRPFEAGERALLVDRRGRRYLITLRSGGSFHLHQGVVSHDDLIGAGEGATVRTSGGATLVAFRPSLADFILKMPRGAQVIYPKDIGLILMFADIAPGRTVLEAGTGSGALTIALARAVGERGRVISYEIREDFHARARANIEAFFGRIPPEVDLRLGDVTAGVDEPVDRVVLDLPEPWGAIPTVGETLRPGGLLCAYIPTALQLHQTVRCVRDAGFSEIFPFEGILRPWHVEGQSVRPEHRMVAHTGFLVIARRLGA